MDSAPGAEACAGPRALVRSSSRKGREQGVALRPVVQPARRIEVTKCADFDDAAAPLIRFAARMFDRAIRIVAARDGERGKTKFVRWRVGEAGGLDREGGRVRVRNGHKKGARDPRRRRLCCG